MVALAVTLLANYTLFGMSSSPNECEGRLPRSLDMNANHSDESKRNVNSKAVSDDAGDDCSFGSPVKDTQYHRTYNTNSLATEPKAKSSTASQGRNRTDDKLRKPQTPPEKSRPCRDGANNQGGTQVADAVLALDGFKEHCGHLMQAELNALENILQDLA